MLSLHISHRSRMSQCRLQLCPCTQLLYALTWHLRSHTKCVIPCKSLNWCLHIKFPCPHQWCSTPSAKCFHFTSCMSQCRQQLCPSVEVLHALTSHLRTNTTCVLLQNLTQVLSHHICMATSTIIKCSAKLPTPVVSFCASAWCSLMQSPCVVIHIWSLYPHQMCTVYMYFYVQVLQCVHVWSICL